MKPEKSREWMYNYIKRNKCNTWIDDDLSVQNVKVKHFLYNTEYINEQISDEIIKILKCSLNTITHDRISSILDAIFLHHLDSNSIVVIIKPKDNCVGFVAGRQSSNLFSIKRLISNISGKYRRSSNNNMTITVDIFQFMK